MLCNALAAHNSHQELDNNPCAAGAVQARMAFQPATLCPISLQPVYRDLQSACIQRTVPLGKMHGLESITPSRDMVILSKGSRHENDSSRRAWVEERESLKRGSKSKRTG